LSKFLIRKLEENSKEKLQDRRCELREELLKEGGGEDAEKRDSFLVRLNAIIQPSLSCFTQSSLGKSSYAVAIALDSLKLHGA
jgi:hypothetical protein